MKVPYQGTQVEGQLVCPQRVIFNTTQAKSACAGIRAFYCLQFSLRLKVPPFFSNWSFSAVQSSIGSIRPVYPTDASYPQHS